MHKLLDRNLESLEEGMTASFTTTIAAKDLEMFGQVAVDHAPIHYNSAFAQSMGYDKPIVYGFLVFSRFSGLLGMVLPGPRTVIHSASFKMAKAVYIDDVLTYAVRVTKIIKSVKTVVLALTVSRFPDEIILKGEAQCGFLT